jgi:hypothetical protein
MKGRRFLNFSKAESRVDRRRNFNYTSGMKASLTPRKRNGFCTIFAALIILTTCCHAEETNHSFGIYLIESAHDYRDFIAYWRGTNDWSHLILKPTPVIASDDIIAYNFTNHLMTLTPEAFQRISHDASWMSASASGGVPFVVVADGQRVYLGSFGGGGGSIPICVPLIGGTDRPNTLMIYRDYACDPRNSSDPRSDERIRLALEALHKLK